MCIQTLWWSCQSTGSESFFCNGAQESSFLKSSDDASADGLWPRFWGGSSQTPAYIKITRGTQQMQISWTLPQGLLHSGSRNLHIKQVPELKRAHSEKWSQALESVEGQVPPGLSPSKSWSWSSEECFYRWLICCTKLTKRGRERERNCGFMCKQF